MSDRKGRRRSPQQQRSRDLVDAVREAGRLLLEEGGPKALTTHRIAERAGVSVGSLYQYFENKEAIIKAVYDYVDDQQRSSDLRYLARLQDLDPRQRIRAGIEYASERHRRMLDLDPGYYRDHHGDYQISTGFSPEDSDEEANSRRAVEFTRQLLNQLEGEAADRINIEHASFLLGRGLSALLRAALEESPERLHDESFMDELERLFMRYLYPDRSR
jgi:AcrR family transcriptional regulator